MIVRTLTIAAAVAGLFTCEMVPGDPKLGLMQEWIASTDRSAWRPCADVGSTDPNWPDFGFGGSTSDPEFRCQMAGPFSYGTHRYYVQMITNIIQTGNSCNKYGNCYIDAFRVCSKTAPGTTGPCGRTIGPKGCGVCVVSETMAASPPGGQP
jgi:hypothetical protein